MAMQVTGPFLNVQARIPTLIKVTALFNHVAADFYCLAPSTPAPSVLHNLDGLTFHHTSRFHSIVGPASASLHLACASVLLLLIAITISERMLIITYSYLTLLSAWNVVITACLQQQVPCLVRLPLRHSGRQAPQGQICLGLAPACTEPHLRQQQWHQAHVRSRLPRSRTRKATSQGSPPATSRPCQQCHSTAGRVMRS